MMSELSFCFQGFETFMFRNNNLDQGWMQVSKRDYCSQSTQGSFFRWAFMLKGDQVQWRKLILLPLSFLLAENQFGRVKQVQQLVKIQNSVFGVFQT